jgi:hypothetical protein
MKFVEINQIVIGGTLLAVMEHSLYELLIMSINRNHTKRNPGREGGGARSGLERITLKKNNPIPLRIGLRWLDIVKQCGVMILARQPNMSSLHSQPFN